MINYSTQRKLAALFDAIASSEYRAELTKQILAEDFYFEPQTCFKRLANQKDHFTVTDLDNFLQENNVNLPYQQLFHAFQALDDSKFGRVYYEESDPILARKARAREPYSAHPKLPYSIEKKISKLFDDAGIEYKNILRLQEELVECNDFLKREAFYCVDNEAIDQLSFDSVDFFLRKHGYHLTVSELDSLFARLDLDKDDRISYQEFLEGILPCDACRYPATHRDQKQTRAYSSKPLISSLSSEQKQSQQSQPQSFVEQLKTMRPYSWRYQLTDEEYDAYLKKTGYYSQGFIDYIKRTKPQTWASQLNDDEYFEQLKQKRKMREFSEEKKPKPAIEKYLQTPQKAKLTDKDYRDYLEKSQILAKSSAKKEPGSYATPVKPAKLGVSEQRSSEKYKSTVKKTPMKVTEEVRLINAMKDQVRIHRNIEEEKKSLSLRKDFNLKDGFRVFDVMQRGKINKTEFEDGLNSIGLYPQNENLWMLFKKIDKDYDGFISFAEFADIMQPNETSYASLLQERMPSYSVEPNIFKTFTLETRKIIKNLLLMMLEAEGRIEKIRTELSKRPDFIIDEAFETIDQDEDGQITVGELKEFLQANKIATSISDVKNMIARQDVDMDGKISYKEFIKEMTPQSPYKNASIVAQA